MVRRTARLYLGFHGWFIKEVGNKLSHARVEAIRSLFAMRRANGDWFALDDNGGFRVPIFYSSSAAMAARMQDASMECFRPVVIDEAALTDLTTSDGGKGSYWLVSDPLRKLSNGRSLDHQGLEVLLREGEGKVA